jgi:hypothetical protein
MKSVESAAPYVLARSNGQRRSATLSERRASVGGGHPRGQVKPGRKGGLIALSFALLAAAACGILVSAVTLIAYHLVARLVIGEGG